MLTLLEGALRLGAAGQQGFGAAALRFKAAGQQEDVAHAGGQMLATFLGVAPMAHFLSRFGGELGGLLGVAGLAGTLLHWHLKAEQRVKQEQRLRREAIAYLTLDLSPRSLERSDFARLMSRTIATRSSFARAALLLRDGSGAMTVAGSAGIDDLSVEALNRWGAKAAASLFPGANPSVVSSHRVGACSFAVRLERRVVVGCEDPLATLGCARVHVTPLVSAAGLLGAIVVCAETRPTAAGESLQLLLEPIEALALRLSTQLGELPGAQWGKPGEPATARVRERLLDRRRARGPQLQHESRPNHVTTQAVAKPARPMTVLRIPEKKFDRSATVITGLRGTKLS